MKWEPHCKKRIAQKMDQKNYEKILDEISEILYDLFNRQQDQTTSKLSEVS